MTLIKEGTSVLLDPAHAAIAGIATIFRVRVTELIL